MKKYLVISNDEINIKNNKLYSKFNDTINIISALQQKFEIYLYSRSTNLKSNFSFKIKKKIVKINLFSLIGIKNIRFFMISITPRNFIFFIILKMILKDVRGYVILRSNGHKEYQTKYGKIGFFIYDVMFRYLVDRLKVISVSKNITKNKKNKYLTPSELDNYWFKNRKKINTKTPLLLYLGRFRKEKGVYSLINMSNKFNFKFKLTMAGDDQNTSFNKNIKFISEISDKKKIIQLYDNHNIFILPSYTEGSPKVILESLARLRPVIVFKDIKHVKSNFYGVYVSERNEKSLKKNIRYILNNYKKIQSDMKKNNLRTKKKFQNDLIKIIND